MSNFYDPKRSPSRFFEVNRKKASPPIELDGKGQANFRLEGLAIGSHKLKADYSGNEGKTGYYPSSSPNLLHTVEKGQDTGGQISGFCPKIWIWIILVLMGIGISKGLFAWTRKYQRTC